MIKLVALMKAKSGMSREAFIDRYEQVHAPLIAELIPFFKAYRRSYPSRAAAPDHIASAPLPGDFDVLTELWYPDEAAIERQAAALAGDAGPLIAADERDQFDRASMVMFATDERVTLTAALRRGPDGLEGPPPIRATGLLRKRPGLSREAFIEHYETRHVPLALELIRADSEPLFAGYTRTFPLPGPTFPIGEAAPRPAAPFDVITDMWFWTEADFKAFLAKPQETAVGELLTQDEERLFDRSAMIAFVSDERQSPTLTGA